MTQHCTALHTACAMRHLGVCFLRVELPNKCTAASALCSMNQSGHHHAWVAVQPGSSPLELRSSQRLQAQYVAIPAQRISVLRGTQRVLACSVLCGMQRVLSCSVLCGMQRVSGWLWHAVVGKSWV